MKKHIIILMLAFGVVGNATAQNLIKNPSFERYWGICPAQLATNFSYCGFDSMCQADCYLSDWVFLRGSFDLYSIIYPNSTSSHGFPGNLCSTYTYPHTDSVAVGGGGYIGSLPNERELIEGRLLHPLIAGHRYKYGMYVQLADTTYFINAGAIVGINSFCALFTDTILKNNANFPYWNYTPQIQIDQMVTDTQHWVLLTDTFTAAGGERYVSFGNFKTDAQIQIQLVDSFNSNPGIAYYFYDDVSLVDLDAVGGTELGIKNDELRISPNPVGDNLKISGFENLKMVEVMDVLGRRQKDLTLTHSTGEGTATLDLSGLCKGLYFIKAMGAKGKCYYAKFIKQ